MGKPALLKFNCSLFDNGVQLGAFKSHMKRLEHEVRSTASAVTATFPSRSVRHSPEIREGPDFYAE